METLNKIIRSLERKCIDHQFDIDWMRDANKETSGTYTMDEIKYAVGVKRGVEIAIERIKVEIESIQINKSLDNMIASVDKLNKYLDEKQPTPDTPPAEV